MSSLISNTSLIYLFVILFYCLYLDLKRRSISNSYFKIFYFFEAVLILTDLILFPKEFIDFFIYKLLIVSLVFLICILLFYLKALGGSDGKLIIFVFIGLPIRFLSLFAVFVFFFCFFLFYCCLYLLVFFYNKISRNKKSFKILFKCQCKMSFIKRFEIQSGYRFKDLSNVHNNQKDKFVFKPTILAFNDSKHKIQILCHYKPPLVLSCLLSSFFMLIFFML